ARLPGVDVREPGQVADDRADRAPPAAAGREDVPRNRVAAHLASAVARQLEHLPVEQEKARQAELVDQRQLLVEPLARLPFVTVCAAVALLEGSVAHAPELLGRGLAGVREVGVAVAEILGQVELEPRGELAGPSDGISVEREALRSVLRSEQNALAVPSPLRLAAVEGGAAADRDQHVLQRRSLLMRSEERRVGKECRFGVVG